MERNQWLGPSSISLRSLFDFDEYRKNHLFFCRIVTLFCIKVRLNTPSPNSGRGHCVHSKTNVIVKIMNPLSLKKESQCQASLNITRLISANLVVEHVLPLRP